MSKVVSYHVLNKVDSYTLKVFPTQTEADTWVATNIKWHPLAVVVARGPSMGSDARW